MFNPWPGYVKKKNTLKETINYSSNLLQIKARLVNGCLWSLQVWPLTFFHSRWVPQTSEPPDVWAVRETSFLKTIQTDGTVMENQGVIKKKISVLVISFTGTVCAMQSTTANCHCSSKLGRSLRGNRRGPDCENDKTKDKQPSMFMSGDQFRVLTWALCIY